MEMMVSLLILQDLIFVSPEILSVAVRRFIHLSVKMTAVLLSAAESIPVKPRFCVIYAG